MLPLYAHINNASLSNSWPDHCFSLKTVRGTIKCNVTSYEYGSDHFPMYVKLDQSYLPEFNIQDNFDKTKIKWNFNDNVKMNRFYHLLITKLNIKKYYM